MKLTDYLHLKRLSQKEFAASVGVSSSAICYYLQKKRVPTKKIMQKIIDLTDGKVSPNDFFRSSDSAESNLAQINKLSISKVNKK